MLRRQSIIYVEKEISVIPSLNWSFGECCLYRLKQFVCLKSLDPDIQLPLVLYSLWKVI